MWTVLTRFRLEMIQFHVNQISGTIPEDIGNLSRLQWLILSSNRISGTIPSSLAKLKIQNLVLAGNLLSGTIPKEVGAMNLTNVYLSSNHLSGTIPENVFGLSNLLVCHSQFWVNAVEPRIVQQFLLRYNFAKYSKTPTN